MTQIDITQVIDRHDLSDVAERYGVRLKRNGRGYLGTCPFTHNHSGKGRDNFSVHYYDDRWVYNCFGCGQSGDVVSFVRKMESLPGNLEAAHYLEGNQTFTRVERKEPITRTQNPPLPMSKAEAYHKNLNNFPAAVRWWEQQGLKKSTMRLFQVGYSPSHGVWNGDSGEWEYHETYTLPVYINGKLETIRHRLAHPKQKNNKYRPERSGDGAHLFHQDILTDPRAAKDEVLIVAGEKKVYVSHQEINLSGSHQSPFLPIVSATAGCTNWFREYGIQWSKLVCDFRYVFIGFDPNEVEAAERTAVLFGRRASGFSGNETIYECTR